MQLTWYNSRGDTQQALCKLVYHFLISIHLYRICVRSSDPDLQYLHHGRAISESAGQPRAPASLAWHAERDNVICSELWASSDPILCCETVNESRREWLLTGIFSSSTTFTRRLWKQACQQEQHTAHQYRPNGKPELHCSGHAISPDRLRHELYTFATDQPAHWKPLPARLTDDFPNTSIPKLPAAAQWPAPSPEPDESSLPAPAASYVSGRLSADVTKPIPDFIILRRHSVTNNRVQCDRGYANGWIWSGDAQSRSWHCLGHQQNRLSRQHSTRHFC